MHLTETRLAETDQTVDERAHVQSCVRCRLASRSLNSFLDDTPPSIVAPEAQRFTALRSLGTGGMSQVVLSVDGRLGREVARKKLRTVTSARDLERFVREASITARLEHPNIVPVYDLELDPQGSPTLTMRVVRGTSLGEAMRTGALPDRRARLEVFLKVCDAVAFAHSKGIVHRDLKPDNVMVGEFGEVQVVDFGLAAQEAIDGDAAASASAMLTRMGTVMGTPAYMSPEQARGEIARVGPASDVYGLGATLWEIAAGRPPFVGEGDAVVVEVALGRVPSPKDVDPSVPEDLAAIVLRAMATDPRDRYPDVSALRRDVVSFLEHAPVSARVPTIADRLANWFARNRATVMPVAATVVLAVAVLIAGLVAWARQATTARDELARQVETSETARVEAETARADAQHALANTLLTEAHANVTEHPGMARTALIEARRVGSETQQRRAVLALDWIAGSTPTEVMRLPTGNVGQRIEVRPDGREAAVVGIAGGIRRFSLPDGKETGRWEPVPEGEAQGAGWLDDGRWVRLNRVGQRVTVAGEDDSVIASFDVDVPSGTAEVYLQYGDEVAVGVRERWRDFCRVYSLDGRLVRESAFSSTRGGGPDGRAQVYLDVDRGVLESRGRTLWRGRGIDRLLAVLPDRFVAGDWRSVVAYLYGDARELWRVPSGGTFAGEPLDGLVAIGSDFHGGQEIRLLRANDGSDVTHLGLAELGPDVAWSSRLHLLVASTGNAVVAVPVGKAADWPAPILDGFPRSVAISLDGAFVALGSTKVVLLSRATRRVLFELPLHEGESEVAGLRFLDTRRLAIGCDHGVVVVNLADGSARTTATSVPVKAIDAMSRGWVAVLRDGRLITSEDDSAAPARTLHTGVIWDVEVEGDVVLTSGRDPADATARAWSLPSFEPLWVSDLQSPYYGVDATPAQAAFVEGGGRLRVHDLRSGQLAWEARASTRAVFGVSIDDDGTIFTSDVNAEVAAWREGEFLGGWKVYENIGWDVQAGNGVVVAGFGDGTVWWLERGLHDRISAPGALGIARRWLAAHVPEEAARQMAALPRQDLLAHERALLVEMGIDPPTALTGPPFDDGSIAVWQRWLDR